MSSHDPKRSAAIRNVITEFLKNRLEVKIDDLDKKEKNLKLKELEPDHPDRAKLIKKREEVHAKFILTSWLDNAAKRVTQIQMVTHSLKPIHRKVIATATNLFRRPSELPSSLFVSTSCLGNTYDTDVVCDAANLDVYAFLKLQFEDKSLLDLSCNADTDLSVALSKDPIKAQQWMQAFASLLLPRGKLSSEYRAKQLFWMVGCNANDDHSFHLLAPLYPTSLVQRIYLQIQDDRFSENAKAARAARKEGTPHAQTVHEYSDLAIQKIGGANPRNISQLNHERIGCNYLLSSIPPSWKSTDVRPLFGVNSLFKVFGSRREVQHQVRALRRFLEMKPPSNLDTRHKVNGWVNDLIDELLQFRASLQLLPPGWSSSINCSLTLAQRAWLDPVVVDRGTTVVDDAPDRVAEGFARWLNMQLRDPLPVGDPEFFHWHRLAREQFRAFERETV
jgi:CRISPR-associated protein Csy1